MSHRSPDAPRAGSWSFAGEDYVYLSYAPAELTIPASLSSAERDVVRLVATGCSNPCVASARGVSVRTVENQLRSIFRKLGVSSRAELLALVFGAS